MAYLWGCPILPPNQFPPRALPARFRRTRVLIVGCGDVGQRVARQLQAQAGRTGRHGPRVLALTSSPDKRPALQALGITPLLGNLDDARSLRRLRGVAQRVIHLAPPASQGARDVRTVRLLRALGPAPQALVYGSTTGVYGDHAGGWVDEATPLSPSTRRGQMRVEAEAAWRVIPGLPLHIFRLAGIYGPGRGPFEKVRQGTARRIVKPGQVFSRIHVEDIAQVLEASIKRPNPGAVYNLCDDDPAPPQDVIGHAAELLGLPLPEEVAFDEAEMTPMARSFYAESKRVSNGRIKEELGIDLIYPDYRSGLQALLDAGD